MFKKPKNNKNISAPNAPSLDEILRDIETFQVDIEHRCKTKTSDLPANTFDDWWTMFEQIIEDVKCLEMVHSEVEGFKLKLESLALEIDTESKLLRNEADHHLQLIDAALE